MKHSRRFVSLSILLLAGCDASAPPHAPSGHWELSTEYVSNTMLKSDASVAEALKYKQLVRLRGKGLPHGVYSHYLRMARKMRLHPLPALYLDAEDVHALPQAAARFTREGHPLVVLNRSALGVWSPRELVAVLGHELVHLKEKHVTAENLAKAYNHPELSVAHELEADRIGSGPLGSCDPEALEEALQIVFDMDKREFLGENPLKSAIDYDSLTSGLHPHWQERKAALEALQENPPKGCK